MKMTTKMNLSDAKVAANRENALNSTGPVSAEGKERASRNAIKHGLLARDVVVSSPLGIEDRAEFEALLAELVVEIGPRGFIEQRLVERIATCYWRLHRVQRYENGAIHEALETDDESDGELEHSIKKLRQAEKEKSVLDRLTELLARQAGELTPEEKQQIVDLVAVLPIWRRELFALAELSKAGSRMQKVVGEMRAKQAEVIDELRERIKTVGEEEELRRSRRTLLGSLPEDANLLKGIRYETMLDRQIYRAFNELRRIRERGTLGVVSLES